MILGHSVNYITNTISVPELIWSLFTGIGLYCNVLLLGSAVGDLKALRNANINSIREFAAMSNLISEALRTFVQSVFFFLGVIAMLLPAANSRQVPTFSWILTVAFVLMAAILSGSSFIDRTRRRRLISLVMDYEHGLHANQSDT